MFLGSIDDMVSTKAAKDVFELLPGPAGSVDEAGEDKVMKNCIMIEGVDHNPYWDAHRVEYIVSNTIKWFQYHS